MTALQALCRLAGMDAKRVDQKAVQVRPRLQSAPADRSRSVSHDCGRGNSRSSTLDAVPPGAGCENGQVTTAEIEPTAASPLYRAMVAGGVDYRPWDGLGLGADDCFLRSVALTDSTRTLEDVISKWMQRHRQLPSILLPNLTQFAPNNIKIPACRSCNNEHLSRIAGRVDGISVRSAESRKPQNAPSGFGWARSHTARDATTCGFETTSAIRPLGRSRKPQTLSSWNSCICFFRKHAVSSTYRRALDILCIPISDCRMRCRRFRCRASHRLAPSRDASFRRYHSHGRS